MPSFQWTTSDAAVSLYYESFSPQYNVCKCDEYRYIHSKVFVTENAHLLDFWSDNLII